MGRTDRIRRRRRLEKSLGKSFPDYKFENETDLLKFMTDNNWSNTSLLKIKYFKKTGRGICSKRGIRCDDVLLTVSFDLMISIVTLEKDLLFLKCFNNLYEFQKSISYQSLVSTYLVFKSLSSNVWDSYLSTIPNYFSNPYFCSKNELQNLSDLLLLKIVEQNNKIKTNFSQIQKMIDKDTDFYKNFTLERFKWSYFALNSRSIYIDHRSVVTLLENESNFIPLLIDQPSMALAPFLDLFNHSDSAETIPTFKLKPTPTFEIVSKKPFRKNHQIFISYGVHDNTKLLLDYGFIIPNNKFDTIEIVLDDIENYIKSHNILKTVYMPPTKFRYIKQHNLNTSMFMHNSDDIVSHNLLVVLTLLIIDKSQFPNEFDQVAFGSVPVLDDVLPYVGEMIDVKCKEFEIYLQGLQKLGKQIGLSKSGEACCFYFEECINLLNKIKQRFL